MRAKVQHIFASLLLAVVSVAVASPSFDLSKPEQPQYLLVQDASLEEYQPEGQAVLTDSITLTSPEAGSVVKLLSEAQREFVQMEHAKRIKNYANKHYRGMLAKDGDKPQAVTLSWTAGEKEPSAVTVVIAEKQDFTHGVAVALPAGATECKIQNLKLATAYYWKVLLKKNDGSCLESPVGMFTTEDLAPRLIRVDGIENARDLGGRLGLDGKRVKQGMIYRSGQLNTRAQGIPYTQEELAEQMPELVAEAQYFADEGNRLLEESKKKAERHYLTLTLSDTWFVYDMDDAANEENFLAFASLADAPTAYLDVPVKERTLDKKSRFFKLDNPSEKRIAYLMNVFESEEDGYLQLGCGAHWYWKMLVNGDIAFDCTKYGTRKKVRGDSYVFEIPVKKGKNVIAVQLRGHEEGMTWCSVQPEKTLDYRSLYARLAHDYNKVATAIVKVQKGLKPGASLLQPSVADYLAKGLGIRTEVDLRTKTETYGMKGSPIGPQLKWFNYSTAQYAVIVEGWGRGSFRETFRVFLKKENYPIVFHCAAGKDRTGSVAFILNALLGVSDEELSLDWEETAFGNPNAGFNHSKLYNVMVAAFEKLPGNTMTEKVENYILSAGLTKEDIETFRAIMLE